MNDPNDAFERAVQRERRRRRERRMRRHWVGFKIHLRVYLIVNAFLAAIWAIEFLLGGERELWFLHVVLDWGVAVLIHYVIVRTIARSRLGPDENSTLSAA